MGGGDDEITYYSPGGINMELENPDMYRETNQLRDLRSKFRENSTYALDPERYATRRAESGNRAATSVSNRFAKYGMAGSSAEIGAGFEAERQNDFMWDDRMLNDQIRALQVEASLSGQISNNIMGVQNQFANTQNAVIGAQQAAADREAGMWGDIIGAGAMIGGTLLAGPVGAVAAGGMAGAMSGGGGGGGMPVTPMYTGGTGGYSVGNSYGMYGGMPSAYGYGGYY